MKNIEEQKLVQKYKQEEMPLLVQQTLPYIKPEMVEKWKELVIINSDSVLNISVIKMVADMILAVGSGKTFDEMDKEICCEKHGASGFSMSWSINVISKFAVFGDAIRKWWNQQWGIGEEETRVVNAAVIHVDVEPTNGSNKNSKKV